ncbi:hypothetical protein [Rheinheimera nanhaiensis]|uniref:Uncharacterized protein n=1 Tax=Rheinheimera nanhaiensis E407-8 TaxID=562729 RepID=I1DUF6_9GAMM|nr:hypothetical protein [Rheinheimera nanhaiensis]GAB57684.1 hypothetical protein RNAN_0653 [Rheinheimera nanhaiensis E407-8]
MRWLSSFALLLFLNLWCTPQAFAVHDSRLSPLADTQFYAVTPVSYCHQFNIETENSDEPQDSLKRSATPFVPALAAMVVAPETRNTAASPYSHIQPRAPPAIA